LNAREGAAPPAPEPAGDGRPPAPEPAGAKHPRARRRKRGPLLLALIGLLALSHVYARFGPPSRPRPLPADRRALELPEQRATGPTRARARLAWRRWEPAAERTAPVVLALHGSPGSADDFEQLGPLLGARWRVIAPDLPGFGSSQRDPPDCSIGAHAASALALLDALAIERAHLLGFSMGTGVALELIARAPQRVQSLTLLSGIGVQELELLGSHELNHLLHGLQLGIFEAAHWLLPHFGELELVFLARSYARNFYESDQRPLRGILERYAGPALIVHGARDPLVPLAAAREHARIVPQAELAILPDASHFLPWKQAEASAQLIGAFLARAQAGAAPTRAEAQPERAAAAALPFDARSVPAPSGPAWLALWIALALATLVSEDLTCIAAGLLVGSGRLDFASATSACFVGIFVGDLLLYWAGRAFGRGALARAPLKWVATPAGVERASQWFERRGGWAIALSRLTPGARLPTYFTAGLLRTNAWRFAAYFALACAVWTPALVGFAAWAGGELEPVLQRARSGAPWVLGGLALALLVIVRIGLPLCTWRGRRLLRGSLRRKLEYEFWHPIPFYAPIAAYVAWLALRHRSLTVVTAVNPAIPTGGFIGESKSDILNALAGADELVARHVFVPSGLAPRSRLELVQEFQRQSGCGWPLVIKPDVGQRGFGVRIARSQPELEQALEWLACDALAQEYAPGAEFGLFWLREPGATRGRLFSITEKRMPVIEGNGLDDLETLILADGRALCMAKAYFELHAPRLLQVPTRGERVQLVQLGSHCRGAVFLDGEWLRTRELEEAVERIARSFDGFCFGRFDVRASDPQELARGRGFKIIELNGLTSEATHIYDPRVGLRRAWAVLREQWRLAYAIGAQNARAGAPRTSLLRLAARWNAYRRTQRELSARAARSAGSAQQRTSSGSAD
jgi:pimeloyl-ACP methyl ester carboxylesterase/membrane protein DedA with SNARE-associated domain